jgi:hypothetical protein
VREESRGWFGPPVAAASSAAAGAWRIAYDAMVRFSGDPIAVLDPHNVADPAFVMGPVFTLTYRLLGGVDPADPAVVADAERVRGRADTASLRERGHAEAALLVHAGEFLDAATRWDLVSLEHPDDLVASRFVHDVCLHIGDDTRRLPAAERAAAAWPSGSREHGLALGMLSFALEEVGRFEEAEQPGRVALELDPADLWARHALAHVYESTGRHADAIELLVPTSGTWAAQTLLANHMWWHVGLRLLHHGDVAGALDVLDRHQQSTTAFGLSDATALLWRLDLATAGRPQSVERWERLAQHWAGTCERHTCGFLDLHAALAFAAVPDHPGAAPFWDGAAVAHATGDSYNDVTFRGTVAPLLAGIRSLGAGDLDRARRELRGVAPTLHRIGGSVVQRDLVVRTLAALEAP